MNSLRIVENFAAAKVEIQTATDNGGRSAVSGCALQERDRRARRSRVAREILGRA